MRMVSIDQPVCSMSKTANSEPASAAIGAIPVVLNSSIIVPIATPPCSNARFTLLAFIRVPSEFIRTDCVRLLNKCGSVGTPWFRRIIVPAY